MTKYLTPAAIVVAVMLSTIPAAAKVPAANACRYQNRQAGTWTRDEVKATVACLSKRMNVDTSAALYIANRESNFDRFAWNHSSDCRGVYQHMFRYWSDRVHRAHELLHKYAVHDRRWSSPRAQAVVTFAMVKRAGWGPWQ